MLVLFCRVIILYFLVFFVIRLTGKRQISELQPFDLCITLLIADMASVAATNTGVPLLYGIVPIVTLFLVQQLISFLSLKSESIRKAVCGQPLLLISRGVVQEKALKSARYTITDLTEQLRGKDVFTLSNVEYAILETNGELSVLLKGPMQQPTYRDFAMPSPDAAPALMLIQDGAMHPDTLRAQDGTKHGSINSLPRSAAAMCARCSSHFLHLMACCTYSFAPKPVAGIIL